MNITLLLLKQIAVMFVLIMIGYIMFRKGLISQQGSKDMGNILLYIVIPTVIIKNFCIERTTENMIELGQSAVLAVIGAAVAIAISFAIYGTRDGVANLSAVTSNCGFIGIPLAQAALGARAVFYISFVVVIVNILLWTYGIYVMTKNTSYIKAKKLFGNPTVIGLAIGLLIFFIGIPVPNLVTTIFSNVAGLNTPLAMLVLGIYLAQSDLKSILVKKNTYVVSLIRLVVIPLVTLLIFKVVPIGSTEIRIAVLLAECCPVGSAVPIFAMANGADYKSATELVCLSTILSLLTIPVIVTLTTTIL